MQYAIITNSRVIRVFHGDLDKSWWQRGMSRGELDAKKIETVIRQVTGLQRVFRRHTRSCVDFVLRDIHFAKASVAVRMQYPADISPTLAKWK